jgi:hypothetical protein
LLQNKWRRITGKSRLKFIAAFFNSLAENYPENIRMAKTCTPPGLWISTINFFAILFRVIFLTHKAILKATLITLFTLK